jgi:Family of unknown function (DUF6804)
VSGEFPAVIPSSIVAALLLIGIAPIHAYGYYVFLRWATCAAAVFFCIMAWNLERKWLLLIGIPIAILFNPLVPIYLNKETWSVLDLITAVVIFAFSWAVTPKRSAKPPAKAPDQ